MAKKKNAGLNVNNPRNVRNARYQIDQTMEQFEKVRMRIQQREKKSYQIQEHEIETIAFQLFSGSVSKTRSIVWQYDTTANWQLGRTYILAHNGIFCVCKTNTGTYCHPISNVSMPDTAKFDWKDHKIQFELPLIPYNIYSKIITFFLGVMDKYNNAEAALYIKYTRSTDTYDIEVPDQIVSGASVDIAHPPEIDPFSSNNDTIYVMHVHSHNTMMPNPSSQDINDDIVPMLYMIVGRINSAPETTLRFVAHAKHSFEKDEFIQMSDIFEIPRRDTSEVDEWIGKVSTKSQQHNPQYNAPQITPGEYDRYYEHYNPHQYEWQQRYHRSKINKSNHNIQIDDDEQIKIQAISDLIDLM